MTGTDSVLPQWHQWWVQDFLERGRRSLSLGAKTYYFRPHTKYGEGNVFTGVCHSVQGGGGCIQDATQIDAPCQVHPFLMHPQMKSRWMHPLGCTPLDAAQMDAPPLDAPPPWMHPWMDAPSRMDTTPPQNTVNRRVVCILLECILV